MSNLDELPVGLIKIMLHQNSKDCDEYIELH